MQRRLKTAFAGLSAAADGHAAAKDEWQVVLEFLRDTDPVLLQKISRKLINHLSWNGVTEAKELLQRGSMLDRHWRGSNRRREPPLASGIVGPRSRSDQRRLPHRQRAPERERDPQLRDRLDQGGEVQLPVRLSNNSTRRSARSSKRWNASATRILTRRSCPSPPRRRCAFR